MLRFESSLFSPVFILCLKSYHFGQFFQYYFFCEIVIFISTVLSRYFLFLCYNRHILGACLRFTSSFDDSNKGRGTGLRIAAIKEAECPALVHGDDVWICFNVFVHFLNPDHPHVNVVKVYNYTLPLSAHTC